MSRKTQIELDLWRSGLLRKRIANGALQDACATAARCIAALERNRLAQCNGVPKEYDAARREWIMGLDDSDMERMESQDAANRKKLQAALRPLLTPGCRWKFYGDPRGRLVRISDKQNRRDFVL